jgi:Sensors of blue-light using FAD
LFKKTSCKRIMLERLVYRSKATGELGSLGLFNLLAQARVRNATLGITGHLIYDGEFFTQWIEGLPASLDALWESLLRDPRHQEIILISRVPATERRFGFWTMAFSSYSSLNSYNIPGFFPVDKKSVVEEVRRLTDTTPPADDTPVHRKK